MLVQKPGVKANPQAPAEVRESLDGFQQMIEDNRTRYTLVEQHPQHLCSWYSLGSFCFYVVLRLSTCLTTEYSMMLRCKDTVLRNVEHSVQYLITNLFMVVF